MPINHRLLENDYNGPSWSWVKAAKYSLATAGGSTTNQNGEAGEEVSDVMKFRHQTTTRELGLHCTARLSMIGKLHVAYTSPTPHAARHIASEYSLRWDCWLLWSVGYMQAWLHCIGWLLSCSTVICPCYYSGIMTFAGKWHLGHGPHFRLFCSAVGSTISFCRFKWCYGEISDITLLEFRHGCRAFCTCKRILFYRPIYIVYGRPNTLNVETDLFEKLCWGCIFYCATCCVVNRLIFLTNMPVSTKFPELTNPFFVF